LNPLDASLLRCSCFKSYELTPWAWRGKLVD